MTCVDSARRTAALATNSLELLGRMAACRRIDAEFWIGIGSFGDNGIPCNVNLHCPAWVVRTLALMQRRRGN